MTEREFPGTTTEGVAPRMGLTPALLDLACVIAELTALDGRPPSQTECAAEMDLSKGNISDMVSDLQARGWLVSRYPLVLNSAPPMPRETDLQVTKSAQLYLRTNRLEQADG